MNLPLAKGVQLLTPLLLFLCLSITSFAQGALNITSSGTIEDMFSTDGSTINIDDSGFGEVTKHIGNPVNVNRSTRYVSYAYDNGLVIIRQTDGSINIDYKGDLNISSPIDLTNQDNASLFINLHEGNLTLNADITTNTTIPGNGRIGRND